MKTLDRIFGWVLVVASLLHAFGSIAVYSKTPVTLVWALSGTLAGLLVAAVNLLRVGRPLDHSLACISLAASVAWVAVALAYGKASGNILDFRPMIHVVTATVLAAMSGRTLLARREKTD